MVALIDYLWRFIYLSCFLISHNSFIRICLSQVLNMFIFLFGIREFLSNVKKGKRCTKKSAIHIQPDQLENELG